ncbi:heparan-alpha-glucosaminide N-acetyltransferase domain-containing protein [Microbacterium sp. HD4P20]|uniref:heparan-alpha-glucosaminide N-acetyltransferase domain-containing protein n=1 Tax=Microbacterium sp. HD4P20 TaxID=2864874 RepID=UPI001C63BBD6|nr:heparan-alpha-glucosaminide N-acetyltransferase domain-containing protein [Microbacterium sp. HD4P20]MCP2637231.1 heparan-alpha-glucosaminide N-acetyltransferase domain-containing protein [Microbacterium sp. HD4P20]
MSRGYLATRWDRLNAPPRILGVDLARGLAVLGMFAAHLLWIRTPVDLAEPASWLAIVQGRSSILFAVLAGVSVGLVTGGRTPLSGQDATTARLRLVVRALVLWLLGIVLILTGVPVYVILPAYAFLFLLSVPLTGLTARPLMILAAALALVMPFVQVVLDALPVWGMEGGYDLSLAIGWHYPFTTWIAFVAAGLGAARAGVTRRRVQWWLLGAGSALAAVGYGADAAAGVDEQAELLSYLGAVWTARPHSSGLLEVIGSGGFALAVLGASLLVCRSVIRWAVLPLRAVGAMPLTAYTLQLVVWAIVASAVLGDTGDLQGFRDLEPFWPLTMGTIVFCTAWALLVGRGPLEAAVDRVARWTVRGAPARAGATRR